MRICFLSSMHPATDKRVFDKEARTLAFAGHEVVHLAPNHEGGRSEWQQDGVRIVTYAPFSGLKGRFLGLVKLYKMALAVDAEVYHCNEVDSWVVGVWLRIFARRICVFDAHEHYPEEFAEKRIPGWARPLVRYSLAGLMRVLSWFTQRIVVAKKSLLQSFSYMPEGHVLAVQNFVPVSVLPEPGRDRRKDGPIRLIHLGLFNRYRGWPEVLEALSIARCQETELLVLGTINDGSESAFRDTVKRLGLSQRVEYETWLPFDEAMEKVKGADVGVICFQPGFFNHVHALPHKMFDYMGAELAVLAPHIAVEVSEIMEDAECGLLIDSSDSKSIAEAIDKLCDDRTMLREMGRKGREAVLARYNWEAEAKTLLRMYEELESI